MLLFQTAIFFRIHIWQDGKTKDENYYQFRRHFEIEKLLQSEQLNKLQVGVID